MKMIWHVPIFFLFAAASIGFAWAMPYAPNSFVATILGVFSGVSATASVVVPIFAWCDS